MNLADAIRKASVEGVALPEKPKISPPAPEVKKLKQTKSDDHVAALKISQNPETVQEAIPDQANPHVNNGNVVRLELFLTAEQMGGLFRAIMAGQHSVLTAREAASYLRISKERLERLADEGEIPGIILDGRWRFPKPNLDEWMHLQGALHDDLEDQQNVA